MRKQKVTHSHYTTHTLTNRMSNEIYKMMFYSRAYLKTGENKKKQSLWHVNEKSN